MTKVWKIIGLLLIAILASGVVLVTGQVIVQADSEIGRCDNVTAADNPMGFDQLGLAGCNNNNNGGVMEKTSEYVLIEVDCWHSGWCDVCDEGADYSCNPDIFCWFSPCPFTDPVPNGRKVTRIEAEVRGTQCGSKSTKVYINNTLVGSGLQPGDCACGTCWPLVVSSPTYESGFPGYVYGGQNRLGLQIDGGSCISDVHVKIYYGIPLITTTPHGTGGLSSIVTNTAPVNLTNIVVQNATITSTKVSPGEKVDVKATVTNKGGSNGAAKITLYVNGKEAESKGVSLSSGQTAPVDFSISQNEPGTYTVYVNGVSAGSFVVDSFTYSDALIYSVIALFILGIGGILYLVVKRRSV